MKALYQKISSEILNSTLFNQRELPPVKTVDLYKGQYQAWENFEIAPLPAVFFEYAIRANKDNDGKDKLVAITLHVVYEQVLETNNFTIDSQALDFFDFIETIHEIVRNISTGDIGKPQFISQEPVLLERPGIVHTLNYECVFEGYTERADSTFIYTEENETNLELTGDLVKNQETLLTNPFT